MNEGSIALSSCAGDTTISMSREIQPEVLLPLQSARGFDDHFIRTLVPMKPGMNRRHC